VPSLGEGVGGAWLVVVVGNLPQLPT